MSFYVHICFREPVFRPSTFYDDDGKPSHGQYRTSSTATIKRHRTPVIKCIEQRFAQFQGNIDIDRIEPLQVVKYTHEQQVCHLQNFIAL